MLQPSKERIQKYINKVGKENVHPTQFPRQLYKAIAAFTITMFHEKLNEQIAAGIEWDKADETAHAQFKLRVLELL